MDDLQKLAAGTLMNSLLTNYPNETYGAALGAKSGVKVGALLGLLKGLTWDSDSNPLTTTAYGAGIGGLMGGVGGAGFGRALNEMSQAYPATPMKSIAVPLSRGPNFAGLVAKLKMMR